MKNHTQEIAGIMHNSEFPVKDINMYIQKESIKNDKWWLITYVFTSILFGSYFYTSKETVKEAAKPMVEKVRQAYQMRLNVITDSLINNK